MKVVRCRGLFMLLLLCLCVLLVVQVFVSLC